MKTLTPPRAGLLLALLQAGLLVSLGGMFLLERARLPRAWARVAPVDPDLPIRGRYINLTLLVPAPRLQARSSANGSWIPNEAVRLHERRGQLEAIPAPSDLPPWPGPGSTLHARIERVDGSVMARVVEQLAFFIPPDVADPSQLRPGEQLWVEVSLPDEGLPRPIRLGVRRPTGPGDATAPIRPLRLRT